MQGGVDQQGNQDERRALIAQLLPELRATARVITRSRSEADDVMQEAVLRMLRGLDGFTPPPALAHDPLAAMRPWAMTVLRNVFRETWRSSRRDRLRDEALRDEPRDTAPAQEDAHRMHELTKALATLSPLLREALLLVAAQGMSHEQASSHCGVPVGTMKARVSRARRALALALPTVNN